MDRIVDHLFVFEGDGVIEDYWGIYSEYKERCRVESMKSKKNAELQRDDETSSA